MKISVLIFSFQEPRTLERAVLACAQQVREFQGLSANIVGEAEILVVAPDESARLLVERLRSDFPFVRWVCDEGRGKPAAINLGFAQVHGDVVIMTDGDVEITEGALSALVRPFADAGVGAVSGRPVAINDRGTKFGFWAHALTDAGAHEMRAELARRGEAIEASAYLMAVRRELFKQIPEDALTDDPLISYAVARAGRRVVYAPDAVVRVKYPDNMYDWLRQKSRSVAGYYQMYARGEVRMRSFGRESGGAARVWAYARGAREKWWVVQLFVARAWAWARAWWMVRVRRVSFMRMWERVDSTK